MLGTEGLELLVAHGANKQMPVVVLAVVAKGRQGLLEPTIFLDVVTEVVVAQGMRVLLAESAVLVESQVVVLEEAVVAQAKMVRTAV